MEWLYTTPHYFQIWSSRKGKMMFASRFAYSALQKMLAGLHVYQINTGTPSHNIEMGPMLWLIEIWYTCTLSGSVSCSVYSTRQGLPDDTGAKSSSCFILTCRTLTGRLSVMLFLLSSVSVGREEGISYPRSYPTVWVMAYGMADTSCCQ